MKSERPTAATWFEEGMKAIRRSRETEDDGDLGSAIAAFDEALGLQADHFEALKQRGLALALLGRHDAALQSFERVLALRPFDVEVHVGHAEALMAVGEFEKALSAWDVVLAMADQKKSRRTYALRARTLALGRLDCAEAFPAFCERIKSEVGQEPAGRHLVCGDRKVECRERLREGLVRQG